MSTKFWREENLDFNHLDLNRVDVYKWGYKTTLSILLMKNREVRAEYQIVFTKCKAIRYELGVVHEDDISEPEDIIDIQLGASNYDSPAIIHTSSFTLTIQYGTMIIERIDKR